MVEFVDDMEMGASDREGMGSGNLDSTLEDEINQQTSFGNELRQVDQALSDQPRGDTRQSDVDEDSIPYNIQDYLNQHQVSNAQLFDLRILQVD